MFNHQHLTVGAAVLGATPNGPSSVGAEASRTLGLGGPDIRYAPNSTQPQEPSEIERQLARLSSIASEIDSLADRLFSRLDAVLDQREQPPIGPDTQPAFPTTSQLGASLCGLGDRQEQTILRLRRLLSAIVL